MSINLDENKKALLKNLVQLGLNYKEALVYMALLPLGQVGSSKIIQATGLHGQFVYQALTSLERRGLVVSVIKRGRKKFQANNPERLVRLIDHMKTVASESAEQLSQLRAETEEQQFELYQGREAYVAHEFELLERAEDSVTVYVIAGRGDQFQELLGKDLSRYETIRNKKKVRVRYVGSEGQRAELKEAQQKRANFEYKILPGAFTGLVNINVWPDVIGFNLFGTPVIAFTLKSRKVAESYRAFFESLWERAVK
jgi:sugar-specific transcriptional regulator TrmB